MASLAAAAYYSPILSQNLKARLYGATPVLYTPTLIVPTGAPVVAITGTPAYCWQDAGKLVTCEDGLILRGVCPVDGPGAAYCAGLLVVTELAGSATPAPAGGGEAGPTAAPTSYLLPGTVSAPPTVNP